MSYTRTTTINAGPGGDSVKQAVLDLDTDLTGAFADLNTHEALTATHGASGAVVGTANTQTLTNKTLTSPKINEDVAITATATELNYCDGVTSAIQTQLNAKAPTASPTFTGVVSVDDGSASAPSITNTGDTNTGIFFPAADTMAIATGGTERMSITSSGSVLIGQTDVSTGAKLEVNGAISASSTIGVNNGTWSGVLGIKDNYVTLRNGSLTDDYTHYALCQSSGGDTLIGAPTGQTISLRINDTPIANISSTGLTLDGAVLIGQTAVSTGAKLEINGSISAVLPTSSAGLAAGCMWNDNGTVKIVT